MTGASTLLSGLLTRKLPPRALGYALLDRLNRWLRTNNNRFSFERLYAEQADPWCYRSRGYERAKYERTMRRIVEWRSGAERAAEIACSIGIFTKELAHNFREVVAVDISSEALRRAAHNCAGETGISFHRSALQNLKLEGRFDLITCAEMLYYVDEKHAPAICRNFANLLRPRGIVVLVGAMVGRSAIWEAELGRVFQPVFKESVTDEDATYQIVIFRNGGADAPA